MRQILGIAFILGLTILSCTTKPDAPDGTIEAEAIETIPGEAELDSITALLEKSPNDAKLLNERAKVFLKVDQLNFALADVGRAILLDSTVAAYYLTISDVYFRMNEPNKSKNALLKANKLQPDYLEPLYRLAQFELYLGQHQNSINYANQMLRIDSRDDRPFMVKGLCYKELGDTAKAIDNYLEAVTENPDNYDAYVELGILHWTKKDPLSEQYLKSALQIRPDGMDALYALGMHYQQNDKLNEAMETYTQIIELDSTNRSAYFNIGYIQYQYLQLYNEALANFDKAVKVDPKYYQAIYMRGLCYEAKGDVAKAKREYSYAIELNPDYGKAADGLNRVLRKIPK